MKTHRTSIPAFRRLLDVIGNLLADGCGRCGTSLLHAEEGQAAASSFAAPTFHFFADLPSLAARGFRIARRREPLFRPRFIHKRRHLVGNHHIGDVILDLGEPMPGAGGNDDHVPGIEIVCLAIPDRRAVVAGPLNRRTVSAVAGRRFRSAISGPNTSVPDPDMM